MKKKIDYYATNEIYDRVKQIYLNDAHQNIIKCVCHYDLNRRILTNRINKVASKSTRRANNQRLIETQKTIIIIYIKRLDAQDMFFILELMIDIVNFIIQ